VVGEAVRLAPVGTDHVDERTGLFGTCGHDAARPVVLEAACNEALAVGEQSRGERVALEAGHPAPVEAKAHRPIGVGQQTAGDIRPGPRISARVRAERQLIRGAADRMNLVAKRMTDDFQEFAATAHVQPPLQMPTAGVVAFVDIGGERRKSGVGGSRDLPASPR